MVLRSEGHHDIENQVMYLNVNHNLFMNEQDEQEVDEQEVNNNVEIGHLGRNIYERILGMKYVIGGYIFSRIIFIFVFCFFAMFILVCEVIILLDKNSNVRYNEFYGGNDKKTTICKMEVDGKYKIYTLSTCPFEGNNGTIKLFFRGRRDDQKNIYYDYDELESSARFTKINNNIFIKMVRTFSKSRIFLVNDYNDSFYYTERVGGFTFYSIFILSIGCIIYALMIFLKLTDVRYYMNKVNSILCKNSTIERDREMKKFVLNVLFSSIIDLVISGLYIFYVLYNFTKD